MDKRARRFLARTFKRYWADDSIPDAIGYITAYADRHGYDADALLDEFERMCNY
jgi:hypothetical protein